MPKEWYISFHGGDERTSLNNIHVYSTDGKKLRKALNKKSVPEGFFAPDNNLYVADRAADCVRIYEAHTGHFLRNLVSGSDQVDRPIHLLLSPDDRYLLLEAAGPIQFCDMTCARTPRRSLSRQNPVVLWPSRNGIRRRRFSVCRQSEFE
jgi:hypothetical protein